MQSIVHLGGCSGDAINCAIRGDCGKSLLWIGRGLRRGAAAFGSVLHFDSRGFFAGEGPSSSSLRGSLSVSLASVSLSVIRASDRC